MMDFSKMHGAGNDFIIVDNRYLAIKDKMPLVKKICHRHFGVGADGFMFVEESDSCDIKMSFYNSDGSEATMCGNGIRCFSKFIFDKKIISKREFTVETGDGIKNITMIMNSPKESIISVGMGNWKGYINPDNKEIQTKHIKVDRVTFEVHCLHMGVPHAVIFVDRIDEKTTCHYGKEIERNPLFADGINVNFVKIIDQNHLQVDTWERGAGKTLACGTGVCASAVIAHIKRNTNSEVEATVAGGILRILIDNEGFVTMEGNAINICEGKVQIE
ncbi:MAG: diaminopimelate epimerase [Peptostreptococcales bacterium]